MCSFTSCTLIISAPFSIAILFNSRVPSKEFSIPYFFLTNDFLERPTRIGKSKTLKEFKFLKISKF